jgi:hypothetical protein
MNKWADDGMIDRFSRIATMKKEDLRDQINSAIAEMKNILSEYDVVSILSNIAIPLFAGRGETDSEGRMIGPQALEYVQSIAVSLPSQSDPKVPDERVFQRVFELSSEIITDANHYFGLEIGSRSEGPEEKHLRFLAIVRRLIHRGDAYERHLLEMAIDLFRPFDDLFLREFGLEARTTVHALRTMGKNTLKGIDQHLKFLDSIRKETLSAIELLREQKSNESLPLENPPEQFRSFFQKVGKQLQEQQDSLPPIDEVFRVTSTLEIPESLLSRLCCTFGDNASFRQPPEWDSWPTNESLVSTRPLIRSKDEFYCFQPWLLGHNCIAILKSLVEEVGGCEVSEKYLKSRTVYLENKSLEYLGGVFGDVCTYRNMHYSYEKNGERIDGELDGLVIYDTNLLLVEAKSGGLSKSAQRGSILRLKSNLKGLITEAYEQAMKARDYIDAVDEPVFRDNEGNDVLRLTGKERYRNRILVNTTLTNLGPFACQLSKVKKMGLLEGADWCWSVNINDLRVICETTEFRSQLISYITQRIGLNDLPPAFMIDELDAYAEHMKESLVFNPEFADRLKLIVFGNSTSELDAYYDFGGPRPCIQLTEELLSLISLLEEDGVIGHSEIVCRILDYDIETRTLLGKEFARIEKATKNETKTKQFSCDIEGSLLSIFGIPEPDLNRMRQIRQYCVDKCIELGFDEYYNVVLYPDERANTRTLVQIGDADGNVIL